MNLKQSFARNFALEILGVCLVVKYYFEVCSFNLNVFFNILTQSKENTEQNIQYMALLNKLLNKPKFEKCILLLFTLSMWTNLSLYYNYSESYMFHLDLTIYNNDNRT